MANCPQCGAPLDANAAECKYCGEKIQVQQPQFQQQPNIQTVYVQPPVNDGVNPAWPIKSKIVAGILAIILGGIGVHKFYLGQIGVGIIYLLFCWTGIPAIIGLIEGIIYLISNDHNFQVKNHVRIS